MVSFQTDAKSLQFPVADFKRVYVVGSSFFLYYHKQRVFCLVLTTGPPPPVKNPVCCKREKLFLGA